MAPEQPEIIGEGGVTRMNETGNAASFKQAETTLMLEDIDGKSVKTKKSRKSTGKKKKKKKSSANLPVEGETNRSVPAPEEEIKFNEVSIGAFKQS
jgi:hypothetical protein